MKHSHIIHHYWTSPCGILDLASIGDELVMCDWVDGWHRAATLNRLTRLTKLPMVEDASSVIDLAQMQLEEYFDQRREVFSVPLRLIGSEFQTHIWHALTKIPYGKTISYGEIAREVNSPKAVRAVGGGRCCGRQSAFHHHSLSPRRRREWFHHGLWRWICRQTSSSCVGTWTRG